MIQVSHLQKSFGERPLLKDVSFHLGAGEIVGLVGPSGGGKSVLLKILGRVLEQDSGEVIALRQGREGGDLRVGFLFQEGALFDSLSVLENVAFPLLTSCDLGKQGRNPHSDCDTQQAFRQAVDILREVGLEHAIQKMPGQLSGGMRRRVALARALVSHPELVLLDDPTGGLDPVAATVIVDLIQTLHRAYNPTVVIVSHDIRRLLPNVKRVLALFDGRIVSDLQPQELIEKAPVEVTHFLATRFDFSDLHGVA